MEQLQSVIKKYFENIKNQKRIDRSIYPQSIYFSTELIEKIKTIRSYTTPSAGFFASKDKVGISGWEYAIQCVYFVDKLYIGKPIAGNYSSVSISQKIHVEPLYRNNNQEVSFSLHIGDLQQKTAWYQTKNINKPIFGVGALFHTHPKVVDREGNVHYSFFSGQDIHSLIYGNSPIVGLIAGSDIWLACKTSSSANISGSCLNSINSNTKQRIFIEQNSEIKKELFDSNIVFYEGTLGQKLTKVV